MAQPKSLHLPKLSSKLLLLYAHSEIKTQAQLAAHLNIAKATLSGYVNGDSRKLREPGFVPDDIRQKIAALVSEASKGRLSIARAEALLLGQLDAFARALAGSPARSLDNVLAENPHRLQINVGIVDIDSLGMLEEPPTVPVGATVIRPRQGIYFELDALRRGHCLTVLIETTQGWMSLVPGPRHTGRLRGSRERIPSDPAAHLRFKSEMGIDRFLFLETKTSEPLTLSEPGRVSALQSPELEPLVDALLDTRQVHTWRWGEAYIVVGDDTGAA